MSYPTATHVSQHLLWSELACKDGTAYPVEYASRAVALAAVFEQIRFACGNQPITILSAYRSPAHNRKVGGARNSQHVQGRALDLRPPKGFTVATFYTLLRDMAARPFSAIKGLGKYERHGFVHVDIRPQDRLAVWDGGSAAKDAA
jgi:uncharacterized protein YcbK (DUF882 family)